MVLVFLCFILFENAFDFLTCFEMRIFWYFLRPQIAINWPPKVATLSDKHETWHNLSEKVATSSLLIQSSKTIFLLHQDLLKSGMSKN